MINAQRQKAKLLSWGAVALMALAATVWVIRQVLPPAMTAIASASGAVADARWSDGDWFWIETRPEKAPRLVRVSGGRETEVVSDPGLTTYAAAKGQVAYVLPKAREWALFVSSAASGGAREIVTVPTQPHGILFDGDRLLWLDQTEPLLDAAPPIPPLGARTRLMSVPLSGGTPVELARVMEPLAGGVVGVADGKVVFTAYRHGQPGGTAIYRTKSQAGGAERIAAVAGLQTAVVSSNGLIYWTAPSAEASNSSRTVCVHVAGARGVFTTADWLDGYGRLQATPKGVFYLEEGARGSAWAIGSEGRLARSIELPDSVRVRAVGNGALLVQKEISPTSASLYRMDMP